MKNHLLLVDSDEDLLVTIQRYLKQCGYQVAIAASGLACIEQLTLKLPDLVVLEPALPDDWAYKVLSHCNYGKSPPVIGLSRRSPGFLSVPLHPYHIKPISMNVLVESIQDVLKDSLCMNRTL